MNFSNRVRYRFQDEAGHFISSGSTDLFDAIEVMIENCEGWKLTTFEAIIVFKETGEIWDLTNIEELTRLWKLRAFE